MNADTARSEDITGTRSHRWRSTLLSISATLQDAIRNLDESTLQIALAIAEDDKLDLRSQDLPPTYAANGSLYNVGTADQHRHQSLDGDGAPLPLPITGREESLDIDTVVDWTVAEMLAPSMKG